MFYLLDKVISQIFSHSLILFSKHTLVLIKKAHCIFCRPSGAQYELCLMLFGVMYNSSYFSEFDELSAFKSKPVTLSLVYRYMIIVL